MRKPMYIVIGIVLLVACGTPAAAPGATPEAESSLTPLTATATSLPPSLWIDPSVPAPLSQAAEAGGLPIAPDAGSATLRLAPSSSVANGPASTWIYALVAPFATLTEGVTGDELKSAWAGNPSGAITGHALIMDQATLAAIKYIFGEPAAGAVRTVAAADLLQIAWAEQTTWAIVPFESIEPRWKVLSVDDQSPIRKTFAVDAYPLKVMFALTSVDAHPGPFNLPASNRDPDKLTTLVMTGVTALVRATAYKMEKEGVDYPARDIRDWLSAADIAHISNEIPFAEGCPFPDPDQHKVVFCSDPKYMDLLNYVGMDVVELTGNHFMDWGSKATLFTLDMYRSQHLPYYGGGADTSDSQNAAFIENHGNKFAFIGCKLDSTDGLTATDTHPGAAACDDLLWMADKVKALKEQGYIVIATFQWQEYYSPEARPAQLAAFRLMADSGATIVSGSQAHTAQAMEFYNRAFIHYGLGNLFFDQMGTDLPGGIRTTRTRDEFLDRHVFYDGRYIGTELLTAELEDYAKPRPMRPDERNTFMTYIWSYTDWSKLP